MVQAAQRAVRALGLAPRILISAGSDDQRFVVHNAGITNSVIYGPGQTGLSHVADERISVADLVLGTEGPRADHRGPVARPDLTFSVVVVRFPAASVTVILIVLRFACLTVS